MAGLRVAVINGPNLNMLGVREPEIYGSATLEQIEGRLREVAGELGCTVTFFQSNCEGALVTAVQQLRGASDAVIINAGAYSHSSLALRDALAAISIPFIEVHISNVHGRERERRRLVLADKALAVICGLGSYGYEAALRSLASGVPEAK